MSNFILWKTEQATGNRPCKMAKPVAKSNFRLSNFRVLDEQNIDELKESVYKVPVIVSMKSKAILTLSSNILACSADTSERDHVISVVAWTHLNNKMFWKARNTWGQNDKIFERPSDIRNCVSECGRAGRRLTHMKTSRFTEFFLIDATLSGNCVGIYDSPSDRNRDKGRVSSDSLA